MNDSFPTEANSGHYEHQLLNREKANILPKGKMRIDYFNQGLGSQDICGMSKGRRHISRHVQRARLLPELDAVGVLLLNLHLLSEPLKHHFQTPE